MIMASNKKRKKESHGVLLVAPSVGFPEVLVAAGPLLACPGGAAFLAAAGVVVRIVSVGVVVSRSHHLAADCPAFPGSVSGWARSQHGVAIRASG